MKNIIYILFLFLLLFNCSKDDIEEVNPTFLEKKEGTVWKYIDLSLSRPTFYIRFIDNLTNPLEFWWIDNDTSVYCYKYNLETINQDEGSRITENSEDFFEYRYDIIDNGIKYAWVTSFIGGSDVLLFNYRFYENDELKSTTYRIFSSRVSDNVDSLTLCDE